MMQPTNMVSRISGMALENRVMPMQNRPNAAMRMRMISWGVPSHRRVADSRSYLRMTASRSGASSAAVLTPSAGLVSGFFLSMLIVVSLPEDYRIARGLRRETPP